MTGSEILKNQLNWDEEVIVRYLLSAIHHSKLIWTLSFEFKYVFNWVCQLLEGSG